MFEGEKYPAWQASGFASRFALPFALEVCKGRGYDIGCNRVEWAFPGAIQIDPLINPQYHALNLPFKDADYIHSSHCLEHLANWVDVLFYWHGALKPNGHLFLYLPDYSQKYWRPSRNRKHVHIFTPQIIKDFLIDNGWKNVFVSGVDLNSSFMAIAEK